MALPDDFDSDLAEATTDLPASVTWEGQSLSVIAGAESLARGDQEDDGYFAEEGVMVVVRTSIITGSTQPASGDTFAYGSRTYRIDRVEDSPCGTALNLHCTEETG